MGHSYVNSYQPTLHGLKRYRILKRLASNKDIAILRADRGSVTSILNIDEYIEKLYDIIRVTQKFKILSADLT